MNKQGTRYPVVQVAGLLTFSILTLLGVTAGLHPEVILKRVCIGTGMIMLAALASGKILKSVLD
jgi:hypothetical protein